MNIAIIIPTLTGGGAERIAGHLSKWLSFEHEVFIFVNSSKGGAYTYNGKLVECSEVNKGKECPAEYSLPILKRKYKIDVSISFMELMNFANIRSRDKDVIILSERTNYSQLLPRLSTMDKHIKEYYNYADAIVSCSFGVKQELVNEYGVDDNRVNVIYNFVDKDQIRESAKQDREPEFDEFINGSEYFVSVGRLSPVKNQIKLIKQYSVFHENDRSGFKLAIIGSGPLLPKLNQLIFELGMNEWVRIFPYSNNPFRYMKGAKAFLFASELEGLPNVLLEAMTLGIPIISSDCNSGPRELILGETDYKKTLSEMMICPRGILVQKDIEENNRFSDAMRWMCLHEDECAQMSHNEIDFMESYSNDVIYDGWMKCIKKAIAAHDDSPVDNGWRSAELEINNKEHLFIYGAGQVGRRVFNTYSNTYKIDAFVCTTTEGQEQMIEGTPVISIKDVHTAPEATAFIIGVGERYLDEVCDSVIKAGYMHYYIPF